MRSENGDVAARVLARAYGIRGRASGDVAALPGGPNEAVGNFGLKFQASVIEARLTGCCVNLTQFPGFPEKA